MIKKKEDSIRSESYYPDSNFYIENKENDVSYQNNNLEENKLSKNQLSNMGRDFEWPNTYWFIAE